MKFFEFQKLLSDFPVFNYQDIRKLNPKFHRNQLLQWRKKGYIIRIRNGYYMFPHTQINEDFLYLCSNKIFKPSYVSLESALAYYGLIPESAFLITAISTNKTSRFNTTIGNFSYHSLKHEYYQGYTLVNRNNISFKLAYPEKALLDLLYIRKPNTLTEVSELRLNRFELNEIITSDKWHFYLETFKSKAINKRAALITSYAND